MVSGQWSVVSNPISLDGPCGANVVSALNGPGLRNVLIQPGETWSFNVAWGDPGAAGPLYACGVDDYGNPVYGGNICNLAARYAWAAEQLGLQRQFQDHQAGDLGGGPQNSVAIWSASPPVAGNIDGRQDLLITNTTAHSVRLQAREQDGAVIIVGAQI